jgi:hypothetical protein
MFVAWVKRSLPAWCSLPAGGSAFAASRARFIARPLVRRALHMRRSATFARDLALLGPVH